MKNFFTNKINELYTRLKPYDNATSYRLNARLYRIEQTLNDGNENLTVYDLMTMLKEVELTLKDMEENFIEYNYGDEDEEFFLLEDVYETR